MRSLWNILLILVAGCAAQGPQPVKESAIMPPVVAQARIVHSAAAIVPQPKTITLAVSRPAMLQASPDLRNWQSLAFVTNSLTIPANDPQQFFRAVTTNVSVGLAWNPSADATVVGYKIYIGGESLEYREVRDVGNVTNCTVTHAAHATNYYAATCYDAAGMESDFSNEASYSPKIQLTIK